MLYFFGFETGSHTIAQAGLQLVAQIGFELETILLCLSAICMSPSMSNNASYNNTFSYTFCIWFLVCVLYFIPFKMLKLKTKPGNSMQNYQCENFNHGYQQIGLKKSPIL